MPFPPPIAYYAFESFDGTYEIDSYDSLNLVNAGDLGTSVVPGLIGNCLAGFIDLWRTNSSFDFGGADFTWRFWYQVTSPNNGGVMLRAANSSGSTPEIRIRENGKMLMTINDGMGNSASVSSAGSVAPNVWHHVICWVDSGVEIGWQLDNAETATTPFLFPFPSTDGFLEVDIIPMAGGARIDEVAIWKGVVLTPAQRTIDYNSGLGRTWPW